MRPTVSFLLGSGFSIPEGLPSVSQLNERLSKVKESEIAIDPSPNANFLNGFEDPNEWHKKDERIFFQEFLNFYNQKILKAGHSFHYENFYDFYSNYLHDRENEIIINKFYESFKKEYLEEGEEEDGFKYCYSRISDFDRTFNQLLASQLHKSAYHEDITILNYRPYDTFIELLAELLITNDVKVHTLNHDLFFDFIGRSHIELKHHFTDGYSYVGSQYYGLVSCDFNSNTVHKVTKCYNVKLERFINKFDNRLCLFKLHGSLLNRKVYNPFPPYEVIRLKDNYAVSRYLVEVYNEESRETMLMTMRKGTVPDFLSGTTNKVRSYSDDAYYTVLFNHFETNLRNSELLIVIGYGFNDFSINEYIEEYYLKNGNSMIVIDPKLPETDLIDKYNTIYIPKSITHIDHQDLLLFSFFNSKNYIR